MTTESVHNGIATVSGNDVNPLYKCVTILKIRGVLIMNIIDYSLLIVLWLVVIVGNVIIKKTQPESSRMYLIWSLLVAVADTVVVIL